MVSQRERLRTEFMPQHARKLLRFAARVMRFSGALVSLRDDSGMAHSGAQVLD